ncbi:hypothetical protein L484_027562 [Morus notabilis]|uniref:Calmodulin-binding protein n=1 Tax=Morus notabilis TaxID=981085 RepID=W9S6C2_9ROSA|nr:uncharacterized protein LOC21410176 [Morus notabilis]EXC17370.1 hypothetical protein L484_027562 [Morus notabilis]
MELQVAVPVPPHDFNFDSACSSPYMTAPSSPQRFGNFFSSAPTSPARISAFYRDFSVPFKWEEKPGVPKPTTDIRDDYHNGHNNDDDDDFEFDFSGQLDRPSLSAADELFDGGKIRPLKPPPRLQIVTGAGDPGSSNLASPRSPKSRISQGKRMVQEALTMSPRRKKDFEIDPFTAAIEETRKEENQNRNQNLNRGREMRAHNSSNFVRKGTRSLSPMRVSDIVFEPEENSSQTATVLNSKASNSNSAYSSFLSAISFATDYKKWKLKDLLLFRSASEGRAPRNDDVLSRSKYAVLSRKSTAGSEDARNSSFRSTDSIGSVSSRRRGPLSAHELHYTVNRAASEEMKKKTFLPYKQGLLGCLGFNPGVGMHDISRRVGSFSRAG